MSYNRRDFVKFFGGALAASQIPMAGVLSSSCTQTSNKKNELIIKDGWKAISATAKDDLVLAEGLKAEMLIGWGDPINGTEKFGFNNDYTAFLPLNDSEDEALFWVNHEYPNPLFVSDWERSKENAIKEKKEVGGSILHIKKDASGKWRLVANSKYNKRLDGNSKIPFAANVEIQGRGYGIGTFGNCAGGVTPWGTVLTCEENYHDYYGEVDFYSKEKSDSRFKWEQYWPENHPHHYGWVVEVDLKTGVAKKQTSLGRFAHECATCIKAKDGRTVVYSGDDKNDEFIYKFISDDKDSLDKGKLYVAQLETGNWLSLDINESPILKKKFKNQLDVLIHCREAGKLLGATPCDRPEDFEIQPGTNNVFLTLTNNKPKGNFHGSILKIEETDSNPLSLTFQSSAFAVGGDESGFSCPDNLIFDKSGNLWMVTDISGSAMNKAPYKKFKNNGLFYFPMSGENAGKAFQIASAPVDAELTGLSFSKDKNTLFMSVQHPGEKSKSLQKLTSTWPHESNGLPRPAVVQIQGPLLDKLT